MIWEYFVEYNVSKYFRRLDGIRACGVFPCALQLGPVIQSQTHAPGFRADSSHGRRPSAVQAPT